MQPNAGFEAAFKDEERIHYLEYRRDRDAVPGKTGAQPAKAKDKEKEPFQDRTLLKALKYIRGQIEKVGAVPSLPESANS